MKWWREKGEHSAHGFCPSAPSLPAIPKCSQTHKIHVCSARTKKKIKGKRGREVRVAGPSLGTSQCSEVWDPLVYCPKPFSAGHCWWRAALTEEWEIEPCAEMYVNDPSSVPFCPYAPALHHGNITKALKAACGGTLSIRKQKTNNQNKQNHHPTV